MGIHGQLQEIVIFVLTDRLDLAKQLWQNMICSFFQKASIRRFFDSPAISQVMTWADIKININVIRIDFLPLKLESAQYIERIEALLIEDVKEAFPQVKINEADAVGDILESVFVQ